MSLKMGQNHAVSFAINQTDTLAGTAAEIVAPVDGVVQELQVVVQAAVTAGDTVKVVNADDDDVVGAVVEVEDAATKGTVYSAESSLTSQTRKVSKGDRIRVVPGGDFATAGAVSGNVIFNTAG